MRYARSLRVLFAAIVAMLTAVVFAGAASAATTYYPSYNDSAAPSGTHVQTGSVYCVVDGLDVDCSTYELAGVGNHTAEVSLTATYSATVTCTNKGGKLVPVKSQIESAPSSPLTLYPDKNGRLTVPSRSSTLPSDSQFTNQATCPNGNWTKDLDETSISLDSFLYTLDFVDYSGHYITITGP